MCVCVLLTNFKQISAQSVKESSKEKTISSHYTEMSLLKHHHVLVPSSEGERVYRARTVHKVDRVNFYFVSPCTLLKIRF